MKRIGLYICVFFSVAAALCITSNVGFAQSVWERAVIAEGDVGLTPSIAIDRNDFIHVVHTYNGFGWRSLRYTTNRYSDHAFHTQNAYNGPDKYRQYPDIVIDERPWMGGGEGKIILCNYREYRAGVILGRGLEVVAKDLSAPFFDEGGAELLDGGPRDLRHVGKYCSIGVDDDSRVHISYFDDDNDEIKYVSVIGGGRIGPMFVTPNTPDAHYGPWNSLVVRPDGTVYVAYYFGRRDPEDHERFILSREESRIFPFIATDVIQGGAGGEDAGYGKYNSCTIDRPAGNIHCCYIEEDGERLSLRYATSEGITVGIGARWLPTTLLTENAVGELDTCSIYYDLGEIHVVYLEQEPGTSRRRVMYRSKQLYEHLSEPEEVVGFAGSVSSLDIASDSNRVPHIVYRKDRKLYHAYEKICGDDVCDAHETCVSCSRDCDECIPEEAVCGNAVINPGEECDDGNRMPGDGCNADCRSESDVAVCGDGVCEPGAGEDSETCPADCNISAPPCGDDICEAGESVESCPEDCMEIDVSRPVCGDGVCSAGEDSTSCSADCQEQKVPEGGGGDLACGDGICAEGEDCVADCMKAATVRSAKKPGGCSCSLCHR